MKRKLFKIIVIIVFLALIANIIFFFIQDKIIFQSKELDKDYVYSFNEIFEEYFIPISDDENLNALLFKSTSNQTKGIILYFHGNRDNLTRWGNYAKDFTCLGYDILMVDYRGYGKSGGKSSEILLYQDAKEVWNWVDQNFNYQKKVIYGRSLGGAIATHLATKVKADYLILETPFDKLNGTLTYYRPFLFIPAKYQFDNLSKLPKVECGITIFAGSDDWVVPLSATLKLKPLLKTNDNFFIINGAGHNNIRAFPDYHVKLDITLRGF